MDLAGFCEVSRGGDWEGGGQERDVEWDEGGEENLGEEVGWCVGGGTSGGLSLRESGEAEVVDGVHWDGVLGDGWVLGAGSLIP